MLIAYISFICMGSLRHKKRMAYSIPNETASEVSRLGPIFGVNWSKEVALFLEAWVAYLQAAEKLRAEGKIKTALNHLPLPTYLQIPSNDIGLGILPEELEANANADSFNRLYFDSALRKLEEAFNAVYLCERYGTPTADEEEE